MMIKDPNMNRNVFTVSLKVKLESSFIFSCAEEKFAGEEFGTIEGKVSAVDFKPMANVKVFSNQILALCLLNKQV
jgi:hypothetical protein